MDTWVAAISFIIWWRKMNLQALRYSALMLLWTRSCSSQEVWNIQTKCLVWIVWITTAASTSVPREQYAPDADWHEQVYRRCRQSGCQAGMADRWRRCCCSSRGCRGGRALSALLRATLQPLWRSPHRSLAPPSDTAPASVTKTTDVNVSEGIGSFALLKCS